jgi:competence protein ComGC
MSPASFHKYRTVNQSNAAFGLAELLIALVCVLVLFLLIYPTIPREKGRSPRVKCTSSLKQLSLAFELWAQDHQNRFPMELPESEGGTREAALAGKLLPNLLIISNQLQSPTPLICPGDKARKPAKTFATVTTLNVSYFLNANAALTNQQHILAGDRNLALAGSILGPGLSDLTDSYAVSWTKGSESHDHAGNVALVDGSAHQVTTRGLRSLLTLGGSTNRFIIP